jgi:hypothetical protein
MTSRMDIWRAAKLLVDQHGADAPIRAAQRADELLAAGDVVARRVARHHPQGGQRADGYEATRPGALIDGPHSA